MVKILIDATPITPNPSGVGLYVLNLIRALRSPAIAQAIQVEALFQPGLKDWLLRRQSLAGASLGDAIARENCQVWDMPVRLSSPLLAGAYRSKRFQHLLAAHLDDRFESPRIIHGTNYSVCPSRTAMTVMNIYDLTFIRYPQFVDRVVKTYRAQVERCLSWTDLVITISESSKRDIVEYLGVEESRIWVTPLASPYQCNLFDYRGHLLARSSTQEIAVNRASNMTGHDITGHDITVHDTALWERAVRDVADDNRFAPEACRREDIGQTLDIRRGQAPYDLRRPYLLFVSTIEPRKNIGNLVKAFNQLKSERGIDHDLLLVGKKGWHYEPIFAEIERSPWVDQIHHLNYLSDDHVKLLYRHADVFVYPSFYEGFGIPVLEAMTLGAPVVTSQCASLPEVGGDAALYADPHDPEAIAEQIWRVIDNRSLRQDLIARGRARAAQFSWQRTAEKTLEAYKSLL